MILDCELDPNIWIWIWKNSKLVLLKKWTWIENMIQLFGSKMDMDWIIKIQSMITFSVLWEWFLYDHDKLIKPVHVLKTKFTSQSPNSHILQASDGDLAGLLTRLFR